MFNKIYLNFFIYIYILITLFALIYLLDPSYENFQYNPYSHYSYYGVTCMPSSCGYCELGKRCTSITSYGNTYCACL